VGHPKVAIRPSEEVKWKYEGKDIAENDEDVGE
jgi:hypothetical protein